MGRLLTESYQMRVDTEEEAMALVEEERQNQKGNPGFKTVYKSKGKEDKFEEWYVVTVTRKY